MKSIGKKNVLCRIMLDGALQKITAEKKTVYTCEDGVLVVKIGDKTPELVRGVYEVHYESKK